MLASLQSEVLNPKPYALNCCRACTAVPCASLNCGILVNGFESRIIDASLAPSRVLDEGLGFGVQGV